MKKMFCCFVGLVFLLAGCGGGGGGSDAPAPAMEAGTWAGTASDQYGVYEDVAVISPDGRFYMLSLTDDTLYAGTVTGSKGTFRAYFTDGTTDSGSFSFDVDGLSMSGTYTMGGVNGTAAFAYVPELVGPASPQTIQGTWRQEYSAADWVQVSVAENGAISGQDSFGCVYGGSISIPDPEVNVYRASLILSECGDMNGTYGGVAIVKGTDMLAMAANSQYPIVARDLVKIGD